MFTGIIESFGTIKAIGSRGEGKVLQINCDLDLSETRIGDSIAVNGACLTATGVDKQSFKVDMAPETVQRTTFKHLNVGSRVNIERALKLSDRIDGHLVSGHIDGTGTIASIERKSNALILKIKVPTELGEEMIEKGSVAVEGISLTINQILDSGSDKEFQISIIPHTAAITTIGLKRPGDEVNIETDMIGKYIKQILIKGSASKNDAGSGKDAGISIALLAKNGFL
jgi:riboflavin synthase